jgi:signal transduction histidine kinase
MKEAVELMQEEAVGPLTQKQKNLLKITASGTEKLSTFVEDILNLTKMEGGLVPIYTTRFDFQRLIDAKLNTFRLLADKKQIKLDAEFHPDPFPEVSGDAERLKQVLANLLANAILFTPEGGRVSIRAESVAEKGLPARVRENAKPELSRHWLKVSVSDTGLGIPKEEWNRVFDKFYQIHHQPSYGTGSGLGLTIAKHIIEAHRGKIWVEESSEKGASFVFLLPQEGKKKDGRTRKSPSQEAERVSGFPG